VPRAAKRLDTVGNRRPLALHSALATVPNGERRQEKASVAKQTQQLERRVWAAEENPNATDAVLVARATRGDRVALGQLYDRHASTAYSLAVRLVGAGADDVVHDAFVALIDRPASFDAERGTFRAWFMTSVHRRCLNQLRSKRQLAGDSELALIADPDPEPPEVIVQQLQDGMVRDALRRLPPAHRDVLVLAYYGGLTQSALAQRLDMPLGTVKARMRRGLLALYAALHGDHQEDQEGEAL